MIRPADDYQDDDGGGICVACGATMSRNHHCNPKVIARIESARKTFANADEGRVTGRTYATRLAEGFRMMNGRY